MPVMSRREDMRQESYDTCPLPFLSENGNHFPTVRKNDLPFLVLHTGEDLERDLAILKGGPHVSSASTCYLKASRGLHKAGLWSPAEHLLILHQTASDWISL